MKFDRFCQFSKAVGRGLLGLLAGGFPVFSNFYFFQLLLLGALVFALGAISLGAPVGSKYMLSTIKWSLLMSALTFLPAAAIFGASWVDWQRIFVKTRPTGFVEYMVCLPAHGAIFGSWFGAWPMPLDWERPWQEWPICVTYGALLGYVIGVVASFVLYFHSRRRQCVKVD